MRNVQKSPALSAVSRAMAGQAAHVGSVADLANVRPQGKGGTVGIKPQSEGQKLLGAELAAKVWSYVRSDGSTLREFCRSVFNLDEAGRKQFRHDLNAHKKAAKEDADAIAAGNADNRQMTGAMIRSAFVRVSELLSVANAADKGATPGLCVKWAEKNLGRKGVTWETLSYANVLAYCRAEYSTATTGRKEVSPIIKAKRYILSQFKVGDYKNIAILAADIAKTIHNEAERVAELESMKGSKAKGEAPVAKAA